jgi:hypothetical protein
VIGHVLDGDGNGAVVPLQHHAEGVADQHGLGTGFVDEAGEGGVVGGDADELLASGLHLVEGADGDFCHWRSR